MSRQPRWPRGTPVAPSGRGPGGGRFREKATGAEIERLALPSAKDILHGKLSEAQISAAADALNGPYGTSGVTVQRASIWWSGDPGDGPGTWPMPKGMINVSGEIVSPDDPNNAREGYFRLTAYQSREKQDGPTKWRAHLDRMHVRGEGQGGGAGRELTARLVDWLRESGFDEITVGPSEIGSYAWGAMGFDFEGLEDRRIALEGAATMNVGQVRDYFEHWHPEMSLPSDRAIARMIRQYRVAAAMAMAGLLSYQSLSQYGRKPGQGRDELWAGKMGLIIGGVGAGRIKL